MRVSRMSYEQFCEALWQHLEQMYLCRQEIRDVHAPFEQDGTVRPVQCSRYIRHLRDLCQEAQEAYAKLMDARVPLAFYALRHAMLPDVSLAKETALKLIKFLQQHEISSSHETAMEWRSAIRDSYRSLSALLGTLEEQMQDLFQKADLQQSRLFGKFSEAASPSEEPFLLREYLQGPQGWGRVCREQIVSGLQASLKDHSAPIIHLSLRGVECMDVVCAGKVIQFVYAERSGQRRFCLVGIENSDLLVNWDAAAHRYQQPVYVWNAQMQAYLLGPRPRSGLYEMMRYVLSVPTTSAGDAAGVLRLRVQNASNKLKSLWEDGYVLRRERSAESGGIEYEYRRIL